MPFELSIFPDGSLASSVITTVWVGVFVVCLFNLRLGWVLSGLVVPGYIAPLMIAKPVAGFVIILEAALTYFIFWVLSEKLSGPRSWSSFFGRDRFMGLILVSVAVRLALDGALLPLASEWLNRNYGFEFDWNSNLHSFGLVVVALYANQLWKPGLLRGMVQSLVVLAITTLIIRYGLMELTNFRISGVAYLYEDFASSIFASPKAYIILIVTCFIASRMNLRYGWEFGGILLPALLALQWYQPLKIVTSVVEAVVIYFCATGLIRTRLFANTTIEGARKLLLFFNISFAYKMLLGHALALSGIEQRITDYYGFGYLLPTLLAIKGYDKDILPRVGRATLQISVTGAALGSAIGFGLMLVVPDFSGAKAGTGGARGAPPSIDTFVAQSAGAAYARAAARSSGALNRIEAEAFRAGVDVLETGGSPEQAAGLFQAAGYALEPTAEGLLAAVPPHTSVNSLLLFNPKGRAGLSIVVSDPTQQPGLAHAAARLFQTQSARWLAIGGTGSQQGDAKASVATLPLFQAATGASELLVTGSSGPAPPILQLAGNAAAALDLQALHAALPRLEVRLTSVAPSPERGDGGRLQLARSAIRELIGRGGDPAMGERPVDGSVEGILTEARGVLAKGRDTRRAEPPRVLSVAEAAFLRFEVVEPLIGEIDRNLPDALRSAAIAAASIGIRLETLATDSGASLVLIRPTGGVTGAYLIRPFAAARPIVQVAADEDARTIETAARLFQQFEVRALLMAPFRPELDRGEGALVSLLTQSLLRSSGDQSQLVVQLRTAPVSFSFQQGNELVIAADRLEPNSGGLAERFRTLLEQDGYSARTANWEGRDAGLELPPNPHVRFLSQIRNKRFLLLWVPDVAGQREQLR